MDHTTVDNTGETPLHLAAVNGHADAAKVLIDFDGHTKIALRVRKDTSFTQDGTWMRLHKLRSCWILKCDRCSRICRK